MKVAISAHGRWHAFELAAQLHRRGLLAQLATTYPAWAARRFLPAGIPLATAPAWEAVRRGAARLPFGWDPDWLIATGFGRFSARHVPDCDLLVAWSAGAQEALGVARRRGIKSVVERGSSHIGHQTEILVEAYGRAGLPWRPTSQGIIDREIAEYEAADAIAVPTGFAAQTFTLRGIPAERLIVNPYGVDLTRFQPPPERRVPARPRILFVGRVGPRKGIPQLIEAFRPLAGSAELHLVGPLEAGMEAWLARADLRDITVRGPVPGAALPEIYAQADIFCLPSLEEGLPLVLLQAMAAGLPVVATRPTGAEDLVTHGRQGLIVDTWDARDQTQALERLATAPDLRRTMGLAARQRVESGFGWDDYGDRAVAHYHRIVA
jgi:glycosyltransferase involved in cell wall biosynthesis